MVVGAGEGDGELKEPQWLVVAAFGGDDVAEVGYGHIGPAGKVSVIVIVGFDQSVLQACGESHLAVAV